MQRNLRRKSGYKVQKEKSAWRIRDTMKKRFLSVVLALILSLSFAGNAFAAGYHENDIEKYIIGQLSNAKIPGGEISIVTSGKEVYSASFGDVPETSSDLKIGSLSKIFTSISILQLIDSNKISLDTKIVDVISSSGTVPDITVEELLKQTSGYTTTQKLESENIPAPLGKKGEYQEARINYAILGKIIEEVSGGSYSDYIQSKIFKPLQLESTYTTNDMSGKDVVLGHDNLFGLPIAKKAEKSDKDEWDAVPATGIISDAKDMGSVLSMFLAAGGKTLSYDQIEKMYADGIDCGNTIFDTKGTSSLGWIKTKVGKQDVYYVSGAIDGYISSAFLVPGQDLGITMLFDTSDVISGNDVIEELMSNVICLAIGEKARTIDSKAVMMPHIEFDIVYVIAFFASLVPFLMMSWWYRNTRKKGVGVTRTIVDALVHIGLPIAIYQCVPVIIESVLGDYIGSWFMIKKFLPECYYVTLLVMAVLFAGVPVKVISAIVAIKKGPFEEEEYISEEFEEENSEGANRDGALEEKSENNTDVSEEVSEETESVENDGDNVEIQKENQALDLKDEDEFKKVQDETEEVAATLEEEHEETVKEADADKETTAEKEEKTDTKNQIKTENETKTETVKDTETESAEVVKEFKTRKRKKEEYESSFEREAVKALENNSSNENQEDIDEDLSGIKKDSDMQTAVPKIKKRYNPQKGMPVKIVVEPDDLDN